MDGESLGCKDGSELGDSVQNNPESSTVLAFSKYAHASTAKYPINLSVGLTVTSSPLHAYALISPFAPKSGAK